MNKQVEQIIAEIKRRLKYTHDWLRGDENRQKNQTFVSKTYYKMKGAESAYDAILSFIDSMHDELVNRDLDKAIEDAMPGVPAWHIDEVGGDSYENAYNSDQMASMFKAGMCWQKEQDVRDMLKSDETNFVKCYERGKEDMRQQMMKNAVEGMLFFNICHEPCFLVNDCENLKQGDKVKLIIVKED